MHIKKGPEIPPDLLRSMGYETRDVIGPVLVRWLAIFAAIVAFCSFGMLVAYNFFVPNESKLVYGRKPTYVLNRVPPMPQLQTEPKKEMADFRRAEYVWENKYFYANDGKTQVNIPVGAALDKMAAQGVAGVKETPGRAKRERGYPGSGDFRPVDLTSGENTSPGDITNFTESANALSEGEGIVSDGAPGPDTAPPSSGKPIREGGETRGQGAPAPSAGEAGGSHGPNHGGEH